MNHTPMTTTALVIFALALPAAAQEHTLELDAADDQVWHIDTRIRHTTVITLPPQEHILDFVVGDSDYWHLTGAANVAYLKPTDEDVETNIALICESGRIYSFLVSETSATEPHLVVRFTAPTPDNPGAAAAAGAAGAAGALPRAPDRPAPAFVARSSVQAFQEMAQKAASDAEAARADADEAIAAFRADYPARLHFPYQLSRRALKRPFRARAMWHDGQFTYLRVGAAETPALYEQRDGDAAIVSYDVTEDGLYIVRRLLGSGWLQLGKKRGRWQFIPPDAP